jgi:ribosomal protein S18 acetylase RimI-like enzyme
VTGTLENNFRIRPFAARDQGACAELYHEGLLGGKLAENDTGLDIDDIETNYMKVPGNHMWVAEVVGGTTAGEGKIVGMIGVQHYEEGVGEIRRLRVHPDFRRRGIGSRLIEEALRWCEERSYLKVTLDTHMDRDAAMNLFQKFHFRHHRSREVNGRELHYFYLDIYQGEPKKPKN